MSEIGKNIDTAISFLNQGETVAIPTETVYGLSANALKTDSVRKIFEVKERPTFNPLIIHTDSVEKMELFVEFIPEKAKLLIEKFSPGPLTYVLKKKSIVPDLVTGGKNSVAIRIPNHPLTLELLKKLDYPLAAPSANPFGFISPTTPQHVDEQLGHKVPYILDGGKCQVGVESTIISFLKEIPEILRFGGISIEQIESVIGKVNIKVNLLNESPEAPGQLKSHYAPNHQLIIGNIENLISQSNFKAEKIGIISFNKVFANIPAINQKQLSLTGDLDQAASELFNTLRELDKQDIDIIYTEIFPDQGIGKAINDRLNRASSEN